MPKEGTRKEEKMRNAVAEREKILVLSFEVSILTFKNFSAHEPILTTKARIIFNNEIKRFYYRLGEMFIEIEFEKEMGESELREAVEEFANETNLKGYKGEYKVIEKTAKELVRESI